MKALVPLVAAFLLVAPAVRAEEGEGAPPQTFQPRSGRFTYGGSFGLGVGSSAWGVSLRGEAGYLVTDRLWTGVSGRLQWTHDEWYGDSYDSFDYGFGAYGRYFVFDRFFVSTEWDWTSYEVRMSPSGSGRESVSTFLVGGGYGQPLGSRSVFLVELLYDVTGNARGLYGTSWVTRFSFVTGF